MASAQVVETSVSNNSPSQDSNHPDDLFTNYHSITNHLKSCLYLLYSGREEPAKQISQKYTLEVSQQQKRRLDKLIEVNFFQQCDGEISNKSFTLTLTLKRKPETSFLCTINAFTHLFTSRTPNESINGKFVAIASNSSPDIEPSLFVSYILKTAFNGTISTACQ